MLNPDTDKTHEIGRFLIQFPLGGNDMVRFFNQSRRLYSDTATVDAPHVRDGVPCLGTVKDVLPQMVANREFASAVQVAITFLESVNTNDVWGRSIVKFPVAPKQLLSPHLRPAETPERVRSRQAYVEACRERLGQTQESARNVSTALQETTREAESDFFYCTRRQFLTSAPIDQGALTAKLVHELVSIADLDKVDMVRATTEGFVVFTKHLPGDDTDGTYPLGKFLIWMRLVGERPGVYWFNASKRVDAGAELMNAPYVYADGRAVAHEVRQSLCALVGQFELASAVDLAIQFVESLDHESPFSDYSYAWRMDLAARANARAQRRETIEARQLAAAEARDAAEANAFADARNQDLYTDEVLRHEYNRTGERLTVQFHTGRAADRMGAQFEAVRNRLERWGQLVDHVIVMDDDEEEQILREYGRD